MSILLRHFIVLAASLAVVSGCADSTTRPAASNDPSRASQNGDVQLSLVVEPDLGTPSQPIAIEIGALHQGDREIWRCDGCGCKNGISFEVIGPDGSPVALTDPAAPQPLCPDVMKTWAAQEVVKTETQFSGTLYERESSKSPTPTYPAPAGTYTVIARFDYATSRDAEPIRLEQTATFIWTP